MKNETLEYQRVFLENVSDPQVPWEVAFANFSDYVNLLQKSKIKNNEDCCNLAYELEKCSDLLIKKAIDPKNIAMSLVDWRDNLGG